MKYIWTCTDLLKITFALLELRKLKQIVWRHIYIDLMKYSIDLAFSSV